MRKPTLLVIDDNELLRFGYRLQLARAGFEALEAENGAVGLRLAQRHLPDAILLDLSMPVLDGWQTIAVLSRDPRTAEIPVIAHTGEQGGDLEPRLRAAGFAAYAGKHLEAEAVLSIVRRVLGSAAPRAGGSTGGTGRPSHPAGGERRDALGR